MFCKHICELLRRCGVNKVEINSQETASRKKWHSTFGLGPLKKDKISTYVNSSLVVTVYRHRTSHTKSKFPQLRFLPHYLRSYMSHNSIFCFSIGTRHNILLLIPSNQITSNITVVASIFSIFYLLHNSNLEKLQCAVIHAFYTTILYLETLWCTSEFLRQPLSFTVAVKNYFEVMEPVF